jgi:hypothetical protein
MVRRLLPLALLACSLAAPSFAAAPAPKPPDVVDDPALAEKMPKTVSGTVTLDGQPLAAVGVTDGVHFVETGRDGRYRIDIRPAPTIPYLPSRTVSISWPSNTWPKRTDAKGPFGWYVRLKDVKDAANVDFALISQKQKLPVVVSFGTDPHDNFTRAHNRYWSLETRRAGDHVTFAVAGGDLGYLGFQNADPAYTSIARFTYDFPVPMFHCIGNHDVVGIHSDQFKRPNELAGNGAFIKYLGPIRWSFDVAGIHFVGTDWAHVDEHGKIQCGMSRTAIDWMEADFARVAKGTPIYFFNHQAWSKAPKFYEVLAKYGVKLCLGGHSHRNMYLTNHKGTQIWTKMSEYTLLYCDKSDWEFVDRCIYKSGRTGWDGHWDHHGRACALFTNRGLEKKTRTKHTGLKDLTLSSETKTIKPPTGRTFDLRVGARPTGEKPATSWGVRVTHTDGFVSEFIYDIVRKRLTMLGRETYFDPVIPSVSGKKPAKGATGAKSDEDPSVGQPEWVEMRLYWMPHRIRAIVNSRLHYQKFIVPPAAKKIETFSEGGSAEFGRIDLWERTWPKDWEPRATANSG